MKREHCCAELMSVSDKLSHISKRKAGLNSLDEKFIASRLIWETLTFQRVGACFYALWIDLRNFKIRNDFKIFNIKNIVTFLQRKLN